MPASQAQELSPAETRRSWRRRLAGIAALVVLVVCGFLVVWTQLRGSPARPVAPESVPPCGQSGLIHAPGWEMGLPAHQPAAGRAPSLYSAGGAWTGASTAGQAGAVVPASFTAQPALSLPSPGGWLRDKVSGGITGLTTEAVQTVVNWLSTSLYDSARSMLTNLVHASTNPDVTAEEFIGPHGAYHDVASFACLGLIGCISLGVIQAMLSGEPTQALLRLPRDVVVAALAIVGFPWAVGEGLKVSNVLAEWMLPPGTFTPDKLADAILPYTALPGANVAVLLLEQLVLFAIIVMSLELVVQTALTYVAVAVAPLSFMTMTTASGRAAARKAVELTIAIVLIKPGIFLALRVGIDLAGPDRHPSPASGTDWAGILLGLAVAGVAAFMPWIIWRMIPSMEQAVVAQGLGRAPFRAGMQAMQTAYFGSALAGTLSRAAGRGATPGGRPAPPGGGGLGRPRQLASAARDSGPGGTQPLGGRSGREPSEGGPRNVPTPTRASRPTPPRRAPGSGTRTLADPAPPRPGNGGPSPPEGPGRRRPPRPQGGRS
ncbi:hypothetical protein [Frankia sp. KB5]|uniref:hypothetical protein n=1 Tax=Frankia sp. KB5 TaxID=683318 RepID=UPI000A0FB29E|nr:hypothetical protein [Frankia sp. KB5]ORT53027.1 hypothetical protein KBI5_08675 [Frankia sp. KB5]